MLLRVVVERCNGCGNCEMACAFVHAASGHPGRPRLTVIRDVPSRAGSATPIVCLQCDDAACVAACPVDALSRNDATGAIELQEARCVRCGSCVDACPFGNAMWDGNRDAVVKCDLCGGDPWCARFCPTAALTGPQPRDSRPGPRDPSPFMAGRQVGRPA